MSKTNYCRFDSRKECPSTCFYNSSRTEEDKLKESLPQRAIRSVHDLFEGDPLGSALLAIERAKRDNRPEDRTCRHHKDYANIPMGQDGAILSSTLPHSLPKDIVFMQNNPNGQFRFVGGSVLDEKQFL